MAMKIRKKINRRNVWGSRSSVAALQLLQQGHEVTGLFMKNWEEDDENGQCSATVDLTDAQQVCDQLGIMLKTVNFSAEYWDDVFENFLHEYQSGRTPNPEFCVIKYIKFRAFLDFALDMGTEFIATGHYVSREKPVWGLSVAERPRFQ